MSGVFLNLPQAGHFGGICYGRIDSGFIDPGVDVKLSEDRTKQKAWMRPHGHSQEGPTTLLTMEWWASLLSACLSAPFMEQF